MFKTYLSQAVNVGRYGKSHAPLRLERNTQLRKVCSFLFRVKQKKRASSRFTNPNLTFLIEKYINHKNFNTQGALGFPTKILVMIYRLFFGKQNQPSNVENKKVKQNQAKFYQQANVRNIFKKCFKTQNKTATKIKRELHFVKNELFEQNK